MEVIDAVRSVLEKKPKSPLHFRDLKHEQKLPYLRCLTGFNFKTVTILVHKPSLKEPEKFQERYRLYFYTTRYLIERASWFCRDTHTPHDIGDGTAKLIFSNRSGMSYSELKDYFIYLKNNTDLFGVRIDWNYIKPDQIIAYSPMKRVGLMIADAIAHSFWRAVERDRFGFTEDRYVRLLDKIIYRRKGEALGYGVKFWPRESIDMVLREDEYRWVLDINKKAGSGP